jgi:twitching motility protein PilT
MQLGQTQTQMTTMNQCLHQHVRRGVLAATTALNYSPDPEELARMLGMQSAL